MGLDRIIVVTPFFGRPEVSKIFIQNIKDLGLRLCSVLHLGEDENMQICQDSSEVVFVNHQNITGQKWNKGIDRVKHLDWDYILILGSDDLISYSYFEEFAFEQMENGVEYIGLMDAVAMNLKTKKCRYFPGYEGWRYGEPIGCGRLIHRRVLKQYGYKIFPEISRGRIDLHSHGLINIAAKSNKFTYTSLKPYRLGLKSGSDITNELQGCPFKYEVSLKGYYSEQVIDLIECFGL